nr:MAG TPA: LTP1, LTP1BP, LIPID TRANSPORT-OXIDOREDUCTASE complex [Caudoviricetes sp.]
MLNELVCLILTLQRYDKCFNYTNFSMKIFPSVVLNFSLNKLTI